MIGYRLRLLCLLVLAGAGATLTACGAGSTPAAAPGSPDRPLVAQTQAGPATAGNRSNEAAASGSQAKPGYEALVQRQSSHPRSRFTPCNLVTAAQARAILGAPMLAPLEAAQGPTCVYRSKDGKSFVALAVQSFDFNMLKPHVRLRHRVDVSNRTAYCGTYGQPMLYVPLSRGRVLTVAAHCAVAKRFAAHAVRQLSS